MAGAAIREATPADLGILLRLYSQLDPRSSAPDSARSAQALAELIADTRVLLLVVEQNALVVGAMTLVFVPNLTHGARPWCQLENMVVDEAHRRAGLGRLLLEYALAESKQRDCYKVQLQSANARTHAHRFYEDAGFEASSRGYRLYLDGNAGGRSQ